MGAGQVAGIVFLTLVMSALLAGAGFMTYRCGGGGGPGASTVLVSSSHLAIFRPGLFPTWSVSDLVCFRPGLFQTWPVFRTPVEGKRGRRREKGRERTEGRGTERRGAFEWRVTSVCDKGMAILDTGWQHQGCDET